jgi:hypothetical protein
MSPLALPKDVLHPWVDEIINQMQHSGGALKDILVQLKTRPTFAEQWPDTYQQMALKGKLRTLEIEKIRNDKYTMRDILAERPDALAWWDSIGN